MGFSWKILGTMILMVVIVMALYNLVIKVYVLPKIKVNKWVVLALGIVMLVLTNVVGVKLRIDYTKFGLKEIPYYLCMALFILFFFAFFDLAGLGGAGRINKKNGKKDIVIKPKAKPNRVKNRDKNKK